LTIIAVIASAIAVAANAGVAIAALTAGRTSTVVLHAIVGLLSVWCLHLNLQQHQRNRP